MSGDAFRVSAVDHGTFRLIRTVMPSSVSEENLSVTVWRFLSHYDTDLPFAVISDYSRVEEFTPGAVAVVEAVIRRSYVDARLRGAAWVVGENRQVAEVLRCMLDRIGIDSSLVVATDAEAVDILRASGLDVPDTT
jgi:hypothetical protein